MKDCFQLLKQGKYTDIDALVQQQIDDAYGKRSVASGSGTPLSATGINNDWGFTGRREDSETGLLFMRARQFSPTLGRFIGRERKRGVYAKELNAYLAAFVPNALDPSGLSTCGDNYLNGIGTGSKISVSPNQAGLHIVTPGEIAALDQEAREKALAAAFASFQPCPSDCSFLNVRDPKLTSLGGPTNDIKQADAITPVIGKNGHSFNAQAGDFINFTWRRWMAEVFYTCSTCALYNSPGGASGSPGPGTPGGPSNAPTPGGEPLPESPVAPTPAPEQGDPVEPEPPVPPVPGGAG